MKKYLIMCSDEVSRDRFKKIIQKKMKIKSIFDYNERNIVGFIVTCNDNKKFFKKLTKKHPRQIKVSEL
jgi:hypothetical protein